MFTSHPDSKEGELDSASWWGRQSHIVEEQMKWEILLWQSLENICHIQIIHVKTLWPPETYGHIHSNFTFFFFFYHITFWTLTYSVLCRAWYLSNESHARSMAQYANMQRMGNNAQNFELVCPAPPPFFFSSVSF